MSAAMLLAAGYGTRLRPLTELRPKALVPVGNRPLLDWHLDALAALGVDSVALNASHLAEQIESHVDSRRASPPQVEVFREENPLDTGGGLLGARSLLEREDRFLVVNADTFHAINLAGVLEAHDRVGADATLVVRRGGLGEPQDELTIACDGAVTGIARMNGATSGWRFTGIHVLTPAVFDYLVAPGSLTLAYEGLLADGAKVVGHDCGDAMWFDVGTPVDYLEANYAATLAASRPPPSFDGVEIAQPALVHQTAEVGTGCSIGPRIVIGEDASIGARSRLWDSVVWPGVLVLPGLTLHRCVAYAAGSTLSVTKRGKATPTQTAERSGELAE